MVEDNPIVFIVDDDDAVRKALSRLITSVGLRVETFSSAIEFLKRDPYDGPACLVLDIRMPGLSGLDLQAELAKAQRTPSIFITAHEDIQARHMALESDAIDFLKKPFEEQSLLDAVQLALSNYSSLKY